MTYETTNFLIARDILTIAKQPVRLSDFEGSVGIESNITLSPEIYQFKLADWKAFRITGVLSDYWKTSTGAEIFDSSIQRCSTLEARFYAFCSRVSLPFSFATLNEVETLLNTHNKIPNIISDNTNIIRWFEISNRFYSSSISPDATLEDIAESLYVCRTNGSMWITRTVYPDLFIGLPDSIDTIFITYDNLQGNTHKPISCKIIDYKNNKQLTYSFKVYENNAPLTHLGIMKLLPSLIKLENVITS